MDIQKPNRVRKIELLLRLSEAEGHALDLLVRRARGKQSRSDVLRALILAAAKRGGTRS